MRRFTSHSSRRLVAALALGVTTAIPALVIIAGQTPASATNSFNSTSTTTVVTAQPDGNKWR